MMTTKIQSVKGMNDILPEQSAHWQHLESAIRDVVSTYSYQEIRFPLLEKTALFVRSVGEVTDIVEKEMYTFNDKGEVSLCLRPEGTAGCVRAAIQHGLLRQTQRLWYMGPMFRRERPQKGRYRQFHQFGVETFGLAGPDIDAEVIAMSARLLHRLGLADQVVLQLNSLGGKATRARYREVLVDYFTQHSMSLDDDSQRRLLSNPLRILDSKNPELAALISAAPSILDYLNEQEQQHFVQLQQLLDAMAIRYTVQPRLVRGLDYYACTVFEWVTDALGAQGTVCAGGRYDGLSAQLGGADVPGFGFAMGMERLLALLDSAAFVPEIEVYVAFTSEALQAAAMRVAEQLRQALAGAQIRLHCGGGSIKSQLKRADKSGARWAVILGETEWQQQELLLKPLRIQGEQVAYNLANLINTIRSQL